MPLLMQILTDDVLLRGDSQMLASLSIGLMLLFGFRTLLNFLQGTWLAFLARNFNYKW